jgi:hypothetical protein
MTYNYDRPPLHPDALPDKPWKTADGGYILPLFIEDSYGMNDDSHFRMNAHYESRTMSDADYALAQELATDISQWGVGWTIGPERQPIAVFGKGSPREGQPVPVQFFPHLTAKVVKRATKGRRLFYKGPSRKERWRNVRYHLGMDKNS